MKCTRFSLLRFSLLLCLTGLFLYSASVQEIHYLFVNHHSEINEHCHNHLHTQTGHVDCNLCKIELGSYVKTLNQFEDAVVLFSTDRNPYNIQQVKLSFVQSPVSPRGPPALA